MLTTIVILLYVCVVLFDFLPSKKKQKKKESIIYFAILSVSFSVLILYSLGIKVPGPSDSIKNIVEKLFMPSR